MVSTLLASLSRSDAAASVTQAVVNTHIPLEKRLQSEAEPAGSAAYHIYEGDGFMDEKVGVVKTGRKPHLALNPEIH